MDLRVLGTISTMLEKIGYERDEGESWKSSRVRSKKVLSLYISWQTVAEFNKIHGKALKVNFLKEENGGEVEWISEC